MLSLNLLSMLSLKTYGKFYYYNYLIGNATK